MKRVALVIGSGEEATQVRVPKGTVLVGIKRFGEDGDKLVGPYSNKVYATPVGRWSRAYARVRACRVGWHVTTPEHAASWNGKRVFLVEVRGAVSTHRRGKAVVGQVRLIREIPTRIKRCDFAGFGLPSCTTRTVSVATMQRAVRAHIAAANRG